MASKKSPADRRVTPSPYVEEVRDRFESSWKSNRSPRIEAYVAECDEPLFSSLLQELVPIDVAYRVTQGETPRQNEYRQRFPHHSALIARAFASIESNKKASDDKRSCHETHLSTCSEDGVPIAVQPAPPDQLGRYDVLELVGRGGFGNVYLAYDQQLQRNVAVKIPHAHRALTGSDSESYALEAQIVAGLDHPHIVNVFDVGQMEDGRSFVVSKYVEGTNLKEFIDSHRPSYYETASLLAKVADALQYAHRQKVIHRDIKPANILIDSDGEPYVTDFGLALRSEEFGRETSAAGTPSYMSPEQARGEGHLVDGRSDIFSLGVVFYELLTGERPFAGDSRSELLDRVKHHEVRPPRQLVPDLPKELERICLKSLAKRATDRYTTAVDMANDLRHFLAAPRSRSSQVGKGADTESEPTGGLSGHTDVVPKGLRSFDRIDAEFFLQLLPGPRDRHGLPDSIRFWKTRIENQNTDETFRVGLLYGPSGCGKSSLVKAGLLPRLAPNVQSVYLEANGVDDELRLLRMLRKRYSGLDPALTLTGSLASIRRNHGVRQTDKTLLVFDQFEQWLHAHRDLNGAELIEALRQCDGERLQCLLLVRDDFWMAVSRFMHALEVPIVEGRNSAAVDLFDPLHAQKVLTEFGRSFGRLADPDHLTKEQKAFLHEAVTGLARDELVIPVRLALFAEMVKGKSWTPAVLRKFGGAQGVTITFLDETFCSPTAPPEHRRHEPAVRAVLAQLLTEGEVGIRGVRRSHSELLEASGYSGRPNDFRVLMRILDSETRLLTPIEPADLAREIESDDDLERGRDLEGDRDQAKRYYQLTHDYLVQPLRAWLTRKQKETASGRAQLQLTERAQLWNARPESRNLPSWLEILRIGLLTRRKDWNTPERQMMAVALRRYAGSAVALLIGLVVVGLGLREFGGRSRAVNFVNNLSVAEMTSVPQVISDMGPYRHWVVPELQDRLDNDTLGDPERVKLRLALLELSPTPDDTIINALSENLLQTDATSVLVIRDAMLPHVGRTQWFWNILADESAQEARRFRAACALAADDDAVDTWDEHAIFVAERLIQEIINDPREYDAWMKLLAPIQERLLEPLADIYSNGEGSDGVRLWAATILARYAEHNTTLLTVLLMTSDQQQFTWLFPRVARIEVDAALAELKKSSDGLTQSERELLAKRQANAAILLALWNEEYDIDRLLRYGPDPSLRSYLIHRFSSFGIDPSVVISLLPAEREASVRRALLLALGSYDSADLSGSDLDTVMRHAEAAFFDADAGLHSVGEWLLRKWGYEDVLKDLYGKLQAQPTDDSRGWYINGQGHTMVIVDGRGDPDVGHRFAIATKEVSVDQVRRLIPNYEEWKPVAPTGDCPANRVSWHDAVDYCNKLSETEGGVKYRLPTEAEWEFACRAGTETRRFYGHADELMTQYAWIDSNSKRLLWPGGRLKPNAWGLFDMYGNASEWCSDDSIAGHRVLRGKNRNSAAYEVDSDASDWFLPETRFDSISFRVARSMPEDP